MIKIQPEYIFRKDDIEKNGIEMERVTDGATF